METPAARRALEKLGFDGVVHLDPFSAEEASIKALGRPIDSLKGVEEGSEDFDWEELEASHVHWTVRPLKRSQVWPVLADQPAEPAERVAAKTNPV